MLKMAKSLYAARDLPAGHILSEADVAIKCPGGGLAPFELERIVGLPLARPLAADDQLTFEAVAGEPRAAGAALATAPR